MWGNMTLIVEKNITVAWTEKNKRKRVILETREQKKKKEIKMDLVL
jgi:hypothetical protein